MYWANPDASPSTVTTCVSARRVGRSTFAMAWSSVGTRLLKEVGLGEIDHFVAVSVKHALSMKKPNPFASSYVIVSAHAPSSTDA
jgi:hypothetical protein